MMEKQSSSKFRPIFFLCLVIYLVRTSFFVVEVESHHFQLHKNHVAFFIFGDSFLDAGNNNYINTTTLDQANFWPYGQTYFRFPTGRFSDGRLVSDFIAEYAKMPLIRPFLEPDFDEYENGVNFASSGAGALSETFHGSVIDLNTQINHFIDVGTQLRSKLGEIEGGLILSKAVYLFSIGTNDYMTLFLTNSTLLFKSYSKSQYVDLVIGNLTTSIKKVYANGGRKFGFMNLPPMGCAPGLRILGRDKDGGCLDEFSEYANLHNQKLDEILLHLEKELKGIKYSLYDFSSSLKLRLDNPFNYGFKEGKEACCGTGKYRGVFSCGGRRKLVKEFELCKNPNKYLFWDSYHLTEKLHKQIADEMWGKSLNSHTSPRPYNLRHLFRTH